MLKNLLVASGTALATVSTAVLAAPPASAIGAVTPASAAVTGVPPAIPSTGVYFGASVANSAGQASPQTFTALETQFSRGMALNRSYSRWDSVQPTGGVRDDVAHGRIPLMSIKPQRTDGSVVRWASVATGAQDTTIRAQADGLRDLGAPIILIFHHEADLAVGYGTAADFVAAFRHYVAIFRGENAANVAFSVVLTPTGFTGAVQWYPGDDVVDWVATDPYNFNACTVGYPGWRSLAQIASTFYNWGVARGKPMLLAEWGSAEDPTQPGRKAAWLRDAATTLASWPAIKAVAYFDSKGTCDWRLDTSASALSAFADVAHSSWANGAPTARLLASVAIGPAPLQETFDLSTSTGAQSVTGTGVANWSLDFGDASPLSTGVGQPTSVTHTYTGGHRTATLTVVAANGAKETTTTIVIAAPPPTVTQGTVFNVTFSSATLPAWAYTSALPGSYYMQWGVGTTFGNVTPTALLAALDYTQAVTAGLTGLLPATRYYWRIVASTAAGTTIGPTRFFSTLAS